MTDAEQALIRRALAAGWMLCQARMDDGREGWLWYSPALEEYRVAGTWHEPTIPAQVRRQFEESARE